MSIKKLLIVVAIPLFAIIYYISSPSKIENVSSGSAKNAEAGNNAIQQKKIIAPVSVVQPPAAHSNISIQAASSASSSQSSSISADAQKYMDADLIRKSEKFQRWLTESSKKPGFNLMYEMQMQFEAEEADVAWASQQEGKFMDMFTETRELSGIALKQAACKSTQCKISVSASNLENANEILLTLSKTLQEKMKNVMIIANPNVENGETILFVSRDEKSFEFN